MAPSPRSRSLSARRTSAPRSAAVSGSSTYTRQRDSSAPFSSKLGFSVVAPISVIDAPLDVGQEGVLLGPVEAVDLVAEEHRARGPAGGGPRPP